MNLSGESIAGHCDNKGRRGVKALSPFAFSGLFQEVLITSFQGSCRSLKVRASAS
jgi:hypothetical protein